MGRVMLTANSDPMSFVTPNHWKTTRRKPFEADEPLPSTMTVVQQAIDGVDTYESGFDIRKGWAGHSN